MIQLLHSIYPAEGVAQTERPDSVQIALNEAEEAVSLVRGGQPAVELSPQSAYVRRLQHLVAERHDLSSQSFGKEPERRVKIFREG